MGVWIIDEIYYDNQDIKIALLANALIIRKSNICRVPIINVADNHTDKQEGTWKIKQEGSTFFLVIKTTNELFSDSFKIEKVRWERDNRTQGQLLKIIFSSKRLRMFCTRDAADVPF